MAHKSKLILVNLQEIRLSTDSINSIKYIASSQAPPWLLRTSSQGLVQIHPAAPGEGLSRRMRKVTISNAEKWEAKAPKYLPQGVIWFAYAKHPLVAFSQRVLFLLQSLSPFRKVTLWHPSGRRFNPLQERRSRDKSEGDERVDEKDAI